MLAFARKNANGATDLAMEDMQGGFTLLGIAGAAAGAGLKGLNALVPAKIGENLSDVLSRVLQHTFDKVLLVSKGEGDATIGKPYVAGSKVTGTVQKHGKTKKVPIVKFRRRKHYMRQGTHRQQYTEVKITGISG